VTGSALAALAASSPSLAARRAALERAAASDAPILILGEAGTGRSALARALHGASRRAARPLVEVDPGALPPSLIESELFGHRAGAFTGAERAHAGRVGRAEGGTLLLDHVEELPLAAQPKLLRLLSERRYAPLGGAEVAADVRFVAIGVEDLRGRVERGAFRDDLFWRLEVLTFVLAPLRRRPEDVLPAADAMLADLAERFARPGLSLSGQSPPAAQHARACPARRRRRRARPDAAPRRGGQRAAQPRGARARGDPRGARLDPRPPGAGGRAARGQPQGALGEAAAAGDPLRPLRRR